MVANNNDFAVNAVGAFDTDLEQDTLAVYEAMQDLIRVYQFRDRDRICCHDLSVTQCYALDALNSCGPLSVNDLSSELYLDKSTASRVVNALERKGYAARRPHPDDRRSVRLEITDRGRELHCRIRNDILGHERRLLAGFDADTRKSMAQLIKRLAEAAADRVQTGGGSCCLKG